MASAAARTGPCTRRRSRPRVESRNRPFRPDGPWRRDPSWGDGRVHGRWTRRRSRGRGTLGRVRDDWMGTAARLDIACLLPQFSQSSTGGSTRPGTARYRPRRYWRCRGLRGHAALRRAGLTLAGHRTVSSDGLHAAAGLQEAQEIGFREASAFIDAGQRPDRKRASAQPAPNGRLGTSQDHADFTDGQYVRESFQADKGVGLHAMKRSPQGPIALDRRPAIDQAGRRGFGTGPSACVRIQSSVVAPSGASPANRRFASARTPSSGTGL